MQKNTPRLPNAQELEELALFTSSQYGYSSDPVENLEEARHTVECASIAVFDNYVTGGPCYFGKVMCVIWDGSPSQYEVYTWKNGQIQLEEQEE